MLQTLHVSASPKHLRPRGSAGCYGHRMRWLVVVVVSGVLHACTQSCPARGCVDAGVTLCAPLDNATHLRVCRNSGCSEIVYEPEVMYLDNGIGAVTRTGGCVVVGTTPRGMDGDIYLVTGWDSDGNELGSYRWTATYERIYPNGEECDRDDPLPCLEATLQPVAP